MSNPADYDAIQSFLNLLERKGLRKRLELNYEDIVDTFWLALQMGVEGTQLREKPESISTNKNYS